MSSELLKSLGLDAINAGTYLGNGEWSSATSGELITPVNPTTGEPIAQVRATTEAEYETVVARAQEAFKVWRTTPAPRRGEAVRLCGEALRKHKDAAPFLEPVDWKVLGIPDYPTIIKRPMDLGTVVRRLDANQYNNVFEVADDVDLVWTNAMTYNMDDSWIHQLAKELKGYADGKWAPLLAAAGGDNQVTLWREAGGEWGRIGQLSEDSTVEAQLS